MSARPFGWAVVLGLTLTAFAQATEFGGVITSIDLKRKQLRLEGRGDLEGERLTFRLTDATKVRFGTQVGTLGDLEVGRRVRIESTPRDGKAVARVVHVLGKRAPRVAADPAVQRASGDLVAGVLRRVALTDRELVVIGPGAKGPETETTIAVPGDARIQRGDKEVAFESLKEDEQVTVRVARRDDRLTALHVQAGPGVATVSGDAGEKAKEKQSGRPKALPRLRLLLKLADKVLDEVEKRRGDE